MKRVVIWGLGEEFKYWRRMLDFANKEENEFQIIAYCDRALRKRELVEGAVAPFKLYGQEFDVVVTSKRILGEVKNELENCGEGYEEVDVWDFEEFIYRKLRVHPNAAGNVMCMDKYCREVVNRTDFQVSSIMEIGANYGQDAEFLRTFWGVDSRYVYTFEANPEFSMEIDRRYKFNNYHYAVSDYTGKAILSIADAKEKNSGISTLKNYERAKLWKKIEIDCICMKDFLARCGASRNIAEIGFLKLDVEGCNYEVLKGFGDYLNRVAIIQTEAENLIDYAGEHYFFNDIAILLINYGFELIYYDLGGAQSDSLWIKKNLLKKKKL